MTEFKQRIIRFLNKTDKNILYVILGKSDCFYLSGFTSSNAYILISNKNSYYYTDGRYYYAAKNKIKHLKVRLLKKNIFETIKKISAGKKITLFKKEISYSFYDNLKKKISAKNIILSSENLISERRFKSSSEIINIKTASEITCKTLNEIKKKFISGITELELKTELEYLLKKNGSDDLAFESIVLFGKNTANPHGHSSLKKLSGNDIILIDCGAKYNGYCSDITRMFCAGKPSAYFAATYKVLLDLQCSALSKLKEGIFISDIEKNILSVLKKFKLKKYYLHSTGHGVGIDIHENPAINKNNNDKLMAGDVITIEPGIYLTNKFGIRIEDTVLINKKGCEILTIESDKSYTN